tara:strand:- start:800 stop:1084 length:285 start_codon:yes stop_codon:yes gene_type:complete
MNKTQMLQAQEERGRAAQELLDNPLFKEAFIKIKGDLFNSFNKTELAGDEARKDIWTKSQVLDAFERTFTDIVKHGQNATLSIAQSDKPLRNVI